MGVMQYILIVLLTELEMGYKEDWQRPMDRRKWDENWEKAFGQKERREVNRNLGQDLPMLPEWVIPTQPDKVECRDLHIVMDEQTIANVTPEENAARDYFSSKVKKLQGG